MKTLFGYCKILILHYYLLLHESLELKCKVGLLVLWNLLPILVKSCFDSFKQINLLFAGSKNSEVVVVDLEEFEKSLAVYG